MLIFKISIDKLVQENLNGTFTYASSCDEYFQQGNRSNGSFLIRPSPTLHAFEVECIFTESEGRTVLKSEDWTEKGFIFPKNEEERCTDPNCFSHSFSYSASNDQLEALIGQSVTCKQKIKHICSTNGLTNLSSWAGRNGVKHTYWSGDRNSTDKGFVISSYF